MTKATAELPPLFVALYRRLLDLFDPVDLPEEEREDLRMIQHNYLHRCLLVKQVMMSTIAAITHTAFVGSIEAVRSPSPKEIAVAQLFLRHLIFITLYILRKRRRNVTVEISTDF